MDIKTVNILVKRRIGSMCYVSSMPEDKDGPIGIGIAREETSYDDLTAQARSRIRCYDDVFFAYYVAGDFGPNIVFPGQSGIRRSFEKKLDGRSFSSEECVVHAIGPRLLKIPTVRNQINPLVEILNAVASFGTVDVNSLHDSGPDTHRSIQYISFLEELGMVRTSDGVAEPGQCLEGWISGWNGESAINALSQRVGRDEIHIMQDRFSFRNIVPYIRMSSVNCISSYSEGRALSWSPRRFVSTLSESNAAMPGFDDIKALTHAYSLQGVDVFSSQKSTDGPVFSCEPVLDKFVELARSSGLEARRIFLS